MVVQDSVFDTCKSMLGTVDLVHALFLLYTKPKAAVKSAPFKILRSTGDIAVQVRIYSVYCCIFG